VAADELGGVPAEQRGGAGQVVPVVDDGHLDELAGPAAPGPQRGAAQRAGERVEGRHRRVDDDQHGAGRRDDVDHPGRRLGGERVVQALHLLEVVELREQGGRPARQQAHHRGVRPVR
jgi:hypothetical protein